MILEQRTKNATSPRHGASGHLAPGADVEERRTGGLRAAFTLIEVLVAMTVLAVMVLMVANIFQSSSAAWNIGTQKADMNTAARAALDYMARELASAVAGPIEKAGSGGANYLTFWQGTADDLRFLDLNQDPDGTSRALRGSYFWLKDQKLRYCRKTTILNCYSDETWYDPYPASANFGDYLITNVLNLSFYVYTNESDLVSGVPAQNNKTHYQLPICVDIALEMLSDDDMRRYIATGNDSEFRARNAKLYSTRVYFPNRQGYSAR